VQDWSCVALELAVSHTPSVGHYARLYQGRKTGEFLVVDRCGVSINRQNEV